MSFLLKMEKKCKEKGPHSWIAASEYKGGNRASEEDRATMQLQRAMFWKGTNLVQTNYSA